MEDKRLFEELLKLKQQINFHDYRYHVLDSPLISDVEFDALMVRLRWIEKVHPDWITPDSPSQRVGGSLSSKFNKIKHPSHILSLGNAFTVDEVRAWYERINKIDERVYNADFVTEPKIDGLTVVLTYRDGIFVQGATRGDGEVGEDITINLRTVKAIPLHIPVEEIRPKPPSYLVVRGEIFIFLREFEKLNRKLEEAGEKTYQNPRNTAAGSLRQLDPSLTASRPLTLLTYAIIAAEGRTTPTKQWEVLQYLKELGFPVSNLVEHCTSFEAMLDSCHSWMKKRDTLPFEADGVVIKLNDLTLASDLGVVGKDPRGALALKFPAREVTTRLVDIAINVGRTGVLTPTAILEPVEVGGVIVRQATLHNFEYIRDKDIRIGDRVLLRRAGDVIPYVIGPMVEIRSGIENVFQPPQKCPVCAQPVEHYEGEVAWYCVNASCPAQLIRVVEHFVSRSAMDIVGLGIKIVEQLIDEGLIHDVTDVYQLNKKELLKMEGFAEKKADNLLAAIEVSKNQSLSRLIFALGIRGVGDVMAHDLAAHYGDLDKLSQVSIDQLQEIEGIGPNIAQAIVDWFARSGNQNILRKLKRAGVWPINNMVQKTSAEGALDGLTFVITGTLPTLSRDEASRIIQQNGGKVTDSVSKKTSYLLLGENPGSKYNKAQELGIPILDEIALQRLISNP